MKNQTAFRRRIVYLCLIAVLLVPLSYISRPSTRDEEGGIVGGGILAQMRRDHNLAQAELGEIDPAGESMKLAVAGARGVAANLLWWRANEYKKKEKWDKLSATLNQITKLQPHFIKVWEFQAWNLSYNVSVEFDDFNQRYHWVVKGIDFIIGGTRYNRDEPKMLSAIGWSTGHKIGRADEKVQYRRLFREDEDFHDRISNYLNMADTEGPEGKPDNWLVSHEWYRVAQQAAQRRPLRGTSPLIFHSRPPMALIDHGVAIEEEGFLNEYAQLAFGRAERAWDEYGKRSIPTSANFNIRLGDSERQQEVVDRLRGELEAIAGTTIDELKASKRQELSDAQRIALDTPPLEWTDEQSELAIEAKEITDVRDDELAEVAAPEDRAAARLALAKLKDAKNHATYIQRYRSIVNYEHWKTRCEVEQRDEAIMARKYIYDADRARRSQDLERAQEDYENAWDEWSVIFTDYPELMEEVTGEDLVDAIKRYKKMVRIMDEEFPPENFPTVLIELIKMHDLKHEILPEKFDPSDGPVMEQDDARDVDATDVDATDNADSQAQTNEEPVSSEATGEPAEPADTSDATQSEADPADPDAENVANPASATSSEQDAAPESGVEPDDGTRTPEGGSASADES